MVHDNPYTWLLEFDNSGAVLPGVEDWYFSKKKSFPPRSNAPKLSDQRDWLGFILNISKSTKRPISLGASFLVLLYLIWFEIELIHLKMQRSALLAQTCLYCRPAPAASRKSGQMGWDRCNRLILFFLISALKQCTTLLFCLFGIEAH